MSGGKPVKLTIDGRCVEAAAGQTLLEAAQGAGIAIPSLCHHKHLVPVGSCRVCLVEIEQQRMLQPACTFPVAEGLVVQTQSPKVQSARLMSLQMIFSERGHYCMICPMSGSADTTDCDASETGL